MGRRRNHSRWKDVERWSIGVTSRHYWYALILICLWAILQPALLSHARDVHTSHRNHTKSYERSCDEISTVDILIGVLSDITGEWKTLGSELHVPWNRIEVIDRDEHSTEEKRRAVLRAWYEAQEEACWEEVVEALKRMDRKRLAGKIEKCKGKSKREIVDCTKDEKPANEKKAANGDPSSQCTASVPKETSSDSKNEHSSGDHHDSASVHANISPDLNNDIGNKDGPETAANVPPHNGHSGNWLFLGVPISVVVVIISYCWWRMRQRPDWQHFQHHMLSNVKLKRKLDANVTPCVLWEAEHNGNKCVAIQYTPGITETVTAKDYLKFLAACLKPRKHAANRHSVDVVGVCVPAYSQFPALVVEDLKLLSSYCSEARPISEADQIILILDIAKSVSEFDSTHAKKVELNAVFVTTGVMHAKWCPIFEYSCFPQNDGQLNITKVDLQWIVDVANFLYLNLPQQSEKALCLPHGHVLKDVIEKCLMNPSSGLTTLIEKLGQFLVFTEPEQCGNGEYATSGKVFDIENKSKETRDIIRHFAVLLTKVLQQLDNANVQVKHFVFFLKRQARAFPDHTYSLFQDELCSLEGMSDLTDVFDTVVHYCSWYNHHLLSSIIEAFSLDGEPYTKYCRDFRKYCRHRVCKLNIRRNGVGSGNGHKEPIMIKIDKHWNTVRMEELEDVTCVCAEILNIERSTLHLRSFEDGCVELHYVVPKFVASAIFPLTLVEESALAESGVILVCTKYYLFSLNEYLELYKLKASLAEKEFSELFCCDRKWTVWAASTLWIRYFFHPMAYIQKTASDKETDSKVDQEEAAESISQYFDDKGLRKEHVTPVVATQHIPTSTTSIPTPHTHPPSQLDSDLSNTPRPPPQLPYDPSHQPCPPPELLSDPSHTPRPPPQQPYGASHEQHPPPQLPSDLSYAQHTSSHPTPQVGLYHTQIPHLPTPLTIHHTPTQGPTPPYPILPSYTQPQVSSALAPQQRRGVYQEIPLYSLHWLFGTQCISEYSEMIETTTLSFNPGYGTSMTLFDSFVLGFALSHINSTWYIIIGGSPIGDKGLEMMVAGMNFKEASLPTSLKSISLNLIDCAISSVGLSHLKEMPEQVATRITELNLAGNRDISEGVASLLSNLTSLKRLDLGATSISPQGAEQLAELLSHSQLHNDNMVSEITSALCDNSTLQTLDLGGNAIGPRGATGLADMLRRNTTLRELDVRGNSIGEEGTHKLATSLEHNTILQTLHLAGNAIGPRGATALAEMLRRNTTLLELHVSSNSIGEEGTLKLATSLEHNKTLEKLWIDREYEHSLPQELPLKTKNRITFYDY